MPQDLPSHRSAYTLKCLLCAATELGLAPKLSVNLL